ncbi:hypothetical protein [Roseicella sp. DB1501]|uniref:hypothetical protein n=1 Tax=Roseicella sp. DB1501 TaxID=2730925 RepID=UPI001491839A|nr:hypothetical protein [Roseicella sp. DB1501]NOG72480.1 hypothetical protein [Roseicella sp. DB1501]
METPRKATSNEERNKDYIDGNHMVFDDDLDMGHVQKYYTEASLVITGNLTVFATSVAPGDGTLTAEKLIGSDGRVFVFVRAPTRKEKASLYR